VFLMEMLAGNKVSKGPVVRGLCESWICDLLLWNSFENWVRMSEKACLNAVGHQHC